MYRTFNSQVIAFIRHCMDEELHALYVSEYNKHEYGTYLTCMVTSNNLFCIVRKYSLLCSIACALSNN